MSAGDTIYILGAGAVGFPLAAYLARAGRPVVAVRTSRADVAPGTATITLDHGGELLRAAVETVSLSRLSRLDGTVVVTAKAQANAAIAHELEERRFTGPVVIMQNGLSVEQPFLATGFSPIYRCVLYITSQATGPGGFVFRPVTASPIGVVHGDGSALDQVVEVLTTERFPFRAEANIQREVWKKAIINAVFNSICPLLDVDNGVFVRDEAVAALAREIVNECLALTERLGLALDEDELIEQILRISRGSEGQLISTLQDIRSGRQTEIEFLNLEIARIGAALEPRLQLPRTELLGKMIVARSRLSSRRER